MTYRRSKPSTQSKVNVLRLNGQGMLTEYRELFVPRKEMQEELASIIFAPKLIVTNNRKLNWYDKDNHSKAQERRVFQIIRERYSSSMDKR
nr:MAG TPA: hypothetical protein [Caudoviricetes sp.]